MIMLTKLCRIVTEQLPVQDVLEDDWPSLIDLAVENHIDSYLWWVLNKQEFMSAGKGIQQTLKKAAHQSAAQFLVLDLSRSLISQKFKKEKIPHIWLKGIALASTVYPEPSLRPMGDLDTLVPFEYRFKALETAQKTGFRLHDYKDSIKEIDQKETHERLHHFHMKGGINQQVTLEVHYRLLGSRGYKLFPQTRLDWLWSQTIEAGGMTILRPEANLLYLCAHTSLQHGLSQFVLTRYLDLHLLITQSEIDWELVVEKAAALEWAYAVEKVLTQTVKLFNTPITTEVFSSLREKRSLDEDIQQVKHLEGEGAAWEKVFSQLKGLSWWECLRLIWTIAFPSPHYMRRRYNIPISKSVNVYYLYRWYDQIRQVGWAIRQRFRIRKGNRGTK